MKRCYYGFQYWSGKRTTTGRPNSLTGRMSIAGKAECFETKKERDAWVSKGDITPDMQGNCRIATNLKGLRKLYQGATMEAFAEEMECLQSSCDNDC